MRSVASNWATATRTMKAIGSDLSPDANGAMRDLSLRAVLSTRTHAGGF